MPSFHDSEDYEDYMGGQGLPYDEDDGFYDEDYEDWSDIYNDPDFDDFIDSLSVDDEFDNLIDNAQE